MTRHSLLNTVFTLMGLFLAAMAALCAGIAQDGGSVHLATAFNVVAMVIAFATFVRCMLVYLDGPPEPADCVVRPSTFRSASSRGEPSDIQAHCR